MCYELSRFLSGTDGSLPPSPPVPGAPVSSVHFENYSLNSHFQPIFSLSMQRPVGYEALLRPRDHENKAVAPPVLFDSLSLSKRKELDCLSHLLHLNNFLQQSTENNWIFLNMTPEVFMQARHMPAGQSFADVLARLGFPPHSVVIEVLEESVRDSDEFENAVAYFRELGCLIALDDFGAGSSNFDRIWSVRPKIVKLDRCLIYQATQKTRVRRILPQLVSLLHEAGAMVLVEGIETEEEAYIALDANADFAQGYLFGRPQPTLTDHDDAKQMLRSVWNTFDLKWVQDSIRRQNAISPYVNAIGNVATLLTAGHSLQDACKDFFALPESTICYLLDESGQQIGVNQWGQNSGSFADPRLLPLKDTKNARWSRCPYFRRALECFGSIQVTRPYLSISSASLCVTVSVSFRHGDEVRVICGDINWLQEMGQ